MFERSVLKEEAKEVLRGNWGRIGGYFLLVFLINIAINFIPLPFLSLFLILIISMPMSIGTIAVGIGCIKREEVNFNTIFEPFQYILKVIGITLWVGLWMMLWMLPGFIIMGIGIGVGPGFGILVTLIGYTLALVMGQIKGYSYRFASYIIAENPEIGVLESLRESIEMTEGYKWALFVLDLSFIGWSLLTLLTCGVGLFWLLPYQQVTLANAYLVVKGKGQPNEAHHTLETSSYETYDFNDRNKLDEQDTMQDDDENERGSDDGGFDE